MMEIINALNEADFAAADWEELGTQLKLEQRLVNIR